MHATGNLLQRPGTICSPNISNCREKMLTSCGGTIRFENAAAWCWRIIYIA
jgi:hypothetical protein